jgi:glycosyltransferase involved in cell wall biosynthesis
MLKQKQSTLPLTVVMITKNEEKNIEDCIKSAAVASEIVVVDDQSTDKTKAIAQNYTNQIFERKMDNEGNQRNYANSKATQTWTLALDADERISSELAAELDQKLKSDTEDISGFAIPIKTFMGKRWIKAAGYYPATRMRLFKSGTLKYEDTGVHPRIFFEGKREFLKKDIIHYGYRDLTHFIDKLNNQTTLEAQKWTEDGRPMSFLRMLRKMCDRFLRNYIGKKGSTDGFLGFLMCCFHGWYQFFTYSKYQELKK